MQTVRARRLEPGMWGTTHIPDHLYNLWTVNRDTLCSADNPHLHKITQLNSRGGSPKFRKFKGFPHFFRDPFFEDRSELKIPLKSS